MQQLLTTKLFIPLIRLELVSRPRLVERLNDGLHRKLTLISAPAGFGKTTLVSEWVEHLRLDAIKENQNENRIAWLSLDENEKDLPRFLTYLIAAIRQAEGIEPTLGAGALAMLQFPQPPPTETILTSLINDIAEIPGKIVLFLDDYHSINSPSIDEALAFIIKHLPPGLHLVIATREDPPLPLARLRARGQLNELRATDLRFTSSEATEFLNRAMDLALSSEDIATLETRTEGWIVGLQLLAISMQGGEDPSKLIKSFTGSHHFVLDYLIEEVLEKQSERVQTFLLQTSVLDQLTGSLCDTITGRQDGQEILEELERANLFIIPLDAERRWYRYHHLFADLLRQRLHQTRLEQAPVLHFRASEWYEKNRYFSMAIEHALHARDFEHAANLIEKNVEDIWQSSEYTNMRRWLSEIPSELLITKPQLGIIHAWDLFASGQHDEAHKYLQIIEEVLDTTNALPSDPVKMRLKGRLFAIRAFMAAYLGDVKSIIQSAHQALEYLPEQDLTWRSIAIIALGDAYVFTSAISEVKKVRLQARELSKASGNIYLFITASLKLASTLRQQGQFQQVIDICQGLAHYAKEHGIYQTYITGWLIAIWGEALAEVNDLDEAAAKVKNVSALLDQAGDIGMIGWGHLNLVRIFFSRGELADAEKVLRKIESIVFENNKLPMVIHHAAYWKVRIWLAQNKLENALIWAEERNLKAYQASKRLLSIEYLAYARILLAQGRLDEANELLDTLIKINEQKEYTTRLIEILILKTLVSQANRETSEAMATLDQALTLAKPGGFFRIFVDEGPPLAQLLYQAISLGISPVYAGQLLAAFPILQTSQTDLETFSSLSKEWIEPLSKRELEVLQLLSEGLTNQEIAAKLYLSLNTVKVHTRNINSKLGTHNRTETAAKARLLGLLPDD